MSKINNPWHRQPAVDPKDTGQRPVPLFWPVAAIAVGCFYSVLALRLAFRLPDLVQDDARQHVFWMARFRDPTLFPNDLIADYFQAVAPAGYKAIYWIFAELGIDPLFLSKILPAIIGVVTAYAAFRLFVRLTNSARGAFFFSVICCQLIWFKDDVVSATPRAFVYPLFLFFLLFIVERKIVMCLFLLALEGLIYPQASLVSLGILFLGLIDLQDRWLVSRKGSSWFLAIGGAVVLAVVLLGFGSSISRYGPTITRAEALALPELLKHGRSQFFAGGFGGFWITGARSGFWPGAIPEYLFILGMLGVAFLIFARRFTRLDGLRNHRILLWRILIAALVGWSAAHLLLFKLHLPARYSHWAIRVLLGMTAAIALMSIFDALAALRARWRAVSIVPGALICLLVAAPLLQGKFPSPTYVQAKPRALFDFLETQPQNVVIATLQETASKIPVFAHRSVLVSAEHAIPYHSGYYREIRQRGRDLVAALLTPDGNELKAFIEKYHVDLMIVPPQPVTIVYVKKQRWFGEITSDPEFLHRFHKTPPPALTEVLASCKIWEDERNIVLDAHAVARTISTHD